MSRWHRLFQINERSHLEENLNRFSMLYPSSKVERVWTENGLWFAHVSYPHEDGQQPTYTNAEKVDEQ